METCPHPRVRPKASRGGDDADIHPDSPSPPPLFSNGSPSSPWTATPFSLLLKCSSAPTLSCTTWSMDVFHPAHLRSWQPISSHARSVPYIIFFIPFPWSPFLVLSLPSQPLLTFSSPLYGFIFCHHFANHKYIFCVLLLNGHVMVKKV